MLPSRNRVKPTLARPIEISVVVITQAATIAFGAFLTYTGLRYAYYPILSAWDYLLNVQKGEFFSNGNIPVGFAHVWLAVIYFIWAAFVFYMGYFATRREPWTVW